MERMPRKPLSTILYRIYDDTGILLYVGLSHRVLVRIQDHLRSQPWASEVCTIRLTRYSTRLDAREAEKEAIAGESPKYNLNDVGPGPYNIVRVAPRFAAWREQAKRFMEG